MKLQIIVLLMCGFHMIRFGSTQVDKPLLNLENSFEKFLYGSDPKESTFTNPNKMNENITLDSYNCTEGTVLMDRVQMLPINFRDQLNGNLIKFSDDEAKLINSTNVSILCKKKEGNKTSSNPPKVNKQKPTIPVKISQNSASDKTKTKSTHAFRVSSTTPAVYHETSDPPKSALMDKMKETDPTKDRKPNTSDASRESNASNVSELEGPETQSDSSIPVNVTLKDSPKGTGSNYNATFRLIDQKLDKDVLLNKKRVPTKLLKPQKPLPIAEPEASQEKCAYCKAKPDFSRKPKNITKPNTNSTKQVPTKPPVITYLTPCQDNPKNKTEVICSAGNRPSFQSLPLINIFTFFAAKVSFHILLTSFLD